MWKQERDKHKLLSAICSTDFPSESEQQQHMSTYILFSMFNKM